MEQKYIFVCRIEQWPLLTLICWHSFLFFKLHLSDLTLSNILLAELKSTLGWPCNGPTFFFKLGIPFGFGFQNWMVLLVDIDIDLLTYFSSSHLSYLKHTYNFACYKEWCHLLTVTSVFRTQSNLILMYIFACKLNGALSSSWF